MRLDAAPSCCDVVGCAEPATGSYLHARDVRLLEFSICAGHYVRLQNGAQPVIVTEGFGLAHADGDAVLILE